MQKQKKAKLSKSQLFVRIMCFILAGLMVLGGAVIIFNIIAYNMA